MGAPYPRRSLEILDAVIGEVPDAGGYFIDDVLVVGYQKDGALVALQGVVEGDDGFQVQVVVGSSSTRMLGFCSMSLQKSRRQDSPPLSTSVILLPSSPRKSIWP